MTQICPGFGVAPVPTLVSVTCNPEAVVTVVPTAWAVAVVDAPTAKTPVNAATRANATRVLGRGKTCILILLRIGRVRATCLVPLRPPAKAAAAMGATTLTQAAATSHVQQRDART